MPRVQPLVVAALLLGACAGAPASPDALVGKEWVLQDLNGRGVVDDSHVTATFAPDGRASGAGGCNRWFGGWKRDGQALTLSQLGSTKMACVEALMHQEASFLSALQETDGWRMTDDGALVLSTRDGRTLTFRTDAP